MFYFAIPRLGTDLEWNKTQCFIHKVITFDCIQ